MVVFDETVFPSNAPRLRREDVRVDVYRDSGPGGQHRNKVESAVRLTHLPTGLVVTATEERSQHQNRTVAWARLEAALSKASDEQSRASTNAVRQGTFGEARAWTWTGWRDEVKGPGGRRTVMSRALAGRLGPLVR